MHYTLLPDQEHLAIHREYRTRVAIVFCFVMVIAGAIGIFALLPAYISSSASEKVQQQAIDSIDTKDSKNTAAMKSEIFKDNSTLSSSEDYIGWPTFSSIVSSIVQVRGPVKFSSLAMDYVGTSSMTIIVQGVAPTRAALLDLQDRLQNLKDGNVVDLPISTLTKSTSVQFSLKVTEQIP